MGVRDNHTKFEQETHRWRLGKVVASGGPRFQKLQFTLVAQIKVNMFNIWPKINTLISSFNFFGGG